MIIDKIAQYVSDLVNDTSITLIIGRENISNEDFAKDLIVIDFLGSPRIIANQREYDYNTEQETLQSILNGTFSLEFYGTNGYVNLHKFINLHNSQRSRDLQKTSDFTVFKPQGFNDLKQLVGNQYVDRYEVEILVQYNESLAIDTYRIESIPVIQISSDENSNSYVVE